MPIQFYQDVDLNTNDIEQLTDINGSPFGVSGNIEIKDEGQMSATSNQLIPENVLTDVVFQVEDADSGNWIDIGSNDDRMTVTETGYYFADVRLRFEARTDYEFLLVRFTVNGIGVTIETRRSPNATNTFQLLHLCCPVFLTSGDYIGVEVLQRNVGSAQANIENASTNAVFKLTQLHVPGGGGGGGTSPLVFAYDDGSNVTIPPEFTETGTASTHNAAACTRSTSGPSTIHTSPTFDITATNIQTHAEWYTTTSLTQIALVLYNVTKAIEVCAVKWSGGNMFYTIGGGSGLGVTPYSPGDNSGIFSIQYGTANRQFCVTQTWKDQTYSQYFVVTATEFDPGDTVEIRVTSQDVDLSQMLLSKGSPSLIR